MTKMEEQPVIGKKEPSPTAHCEAGNEGRIERIGEMTDEPKDQTNEERLGLVQSELREVKDKLSALEAETEERTRETRLNLERILKEIFDNERLKLEEEAEQRFSALSNTQVRYEVKQERLEEAFSLVAESHHVIVQLASVHGERLDGYSRASVQTESRLDVLIDAQMQFLRHMDTLTSDIAALNGRIERIGAHLDRAAEQIISLATVQTRTDEQIKILLDRDGSKKTRRPSTKVAKKEATP